MIKDIRVSRNDIVWTYSGLVLGTGVNLLLLPLLVTFLSTEELGLWYIFAAVGTITTVLDFGLVTTVSRNVTVAWMGADRLSGQGFAVDEAKGPNVTLLAGVLAACRSAYLGLGIAVLALCLGLGTAQVLRAARGEIAAQSALVAWAVYSLAVAMNMALSYWNPLLRGLGRVAESAKANVASKVAQLILTALVLIQGGGLLGVAVAYLISGVIFRLFSRRYFFRAVQGAVQVPLPRTSMKSRIEILSTLWPNSYRQGIVSVSQYAMTSAPVLVGSLALPLSTVAALGATVQLVGLVKVVANSPFNAFLSEFTSLRIRGQVDRLRSRFVFALGMAAYTMAFLGVAALLLGNVAFGWLGSELRLLPIVPAGVFLVNEWAVNQYALCSGLLATANRVPMAKAYALTALATIAGMVVCVTVLGLGIWGILVPSVVMSLAYNDWAWPRRAAQDLGLGLKAMFAGSVVAPVALMRRRVGRE